MSGDIASVVESMGVRVDVGSWDVQGFERGVAAVAVDELRVFFTPL